MICPRCKTLSKINGSPSLSDVVLPNASSILTVPVRTKESDRSRRQETVLLAMAIYSRNVEVDALEPNANIRLVPAIDVCNLSVTKQVGSSHSWLSSACLWDHLPWRKAALRPKTDINGTASACFDSTQSQTGRAVCLTNTSSKLYYKAPNRY